MSLRVKNNFIMVSRSLKLTISIFLLFFKGSSVIYAQSTAIPPDSLFSKMFDKEINSISVSKLLSSDKPVILISTSHCSACVKYFANAQKKYQFVFVINNKSLLEINRLVNVYNLHINNVYFVLPENLKYQKNNTLSGPTPLAFIIRGKSLQFIDYSHLNSATKEFTAPHKGVLKHLNTL